MNAVRVKKKGNYGIQGKAIKKKDLARKIVSLGGESALCQVRGAGYYCNIQCRSQSLWKKEIYKQKDQ